MRKLSRQSFTITAGVGEDGPDIYTITTIEAIDDHIFDISKTLERFTDHLKKFPMDSQDRYIREAVESLVQNIHICSMLQQSFYKMKAMACYEIFNNLDAHQDQWQIADLPRSIIQDPAHWHDIPIAKCVSQELTRTALTTNGIGTLQELATFYQGHGGEAGLLQIEKFGKVCLRDLLALGQTYKIDICPSIKHIDRKTKIADTDLSDKAKAQLDKKKCTTIDDLAVRRGEPLLLTSTPELESPRQEVRQFLIDAGILKRYDPRR